MSDTGTGAVAGPEDMIQALDGKVPIALLPVRLETRYNADATSLRIRIFPDDVHVHTHEAALTATEESDGRRYWRRRLTAAPDGDDIGRAWNDLAAAHGIPRAEWIVGQLTPTNPDDPSDPGFSTVERRDSPWTLPPRVAAMPVRWVAIGLRGGKERFRVWGNEVATDLAFGPSPEPIDDEPDTSAEPDERQDELDIDDGMRWLVDYDEAVRVGMGITVTAGDLQQRDRLIHGVDRLIVVGVDWSRTPDEAANDLNELLTAHRHTEGLGLIEPGTATNATEDSAPPSIDGAHVDARDPARVVQPPSPTSDVSRLTRALGLTAADPLTGTPGSDRDDADAPAHMHRALWAATWGYFFEHLLDGVASDRQVDALRSHFVDHVRGEGPFPTLRIGDQPYGIVPVVAPQRWRSLAEERDLAPAVRVLDDGRGLWEHAVDRSPHMGRTDDPDADLVDVLQQTPAMRTLRFRAAFGPLLTGNTAGRDGAAKFQQLSGRWLLGMLGDQSARSRLLTTTILPQARRLTVPLVASNSEGTLEPNYIERLAGRLRRVGGFVAIRAEDPSSLLHALLLHGSSLEMGTAAIRMILARPIAPNERRARPAFGPEPELIDIENGDRSTTTSLRTVLGSFDAISGTQTMADHIAGLDNNQQGPTRTFGEFRDSLTHLAALPVARLEELLSETLGCSSYRLDAWMTSLATRRLESMRADRSTGIHLGGFGWVEDLRPDAVPGAATSEGFVHVPSIAHAHTAAILRSGHLEHLGDAPGDHPFAVDLSSDRVREALELLDGIQQGQQLGALLGYRFERSLRERDPGLARYILPLRLRAPLRADTGSQGADADTAPAVAARDVVDGVALLEQWRSLGPSLLSQIDATTSGDRSGLTGVLDALDDLFDAASDMFVAESVFQSVVGNVERAGAAAEALDRQHPAPDLDVIRTPRTGHDHTHRVAIVLGAEALPPEWTGVGNDARAAIEPRLNVWVARVLGDPARIRFVGELLDADGEIAGRAEMTLRDLGVSPMSVVALAGSGSATDPSELEQLVALRLAAGVQGSFDTMRLSTDPLPSRSDLSLADLLALAGSIRELFGVGRALRPSDLALAEDDPIEAIDIDDLETRVAGLLRAAEAALAGLDAAFTDVDASADRLRTAIAAGGAVGVRGAVPLDAGDDEASADVLRAQGDGIRPVLAAAIEQARGLHADSADGGDQVVALAGVAQALLGEDFPVLPIAMAASATELSASLADRGALLDGDELAPTTFLLQRSLVRPAVQNLSELLTWAEICHSGTGPTELDVMQLPHRPADRWIATDLPSDGRVPAGRLSIVVHRTTPLEFGTPIAGLVIDDWSERIPSRAETTGVAMQFDAPGTRAPQAVLLAVPGNPESSHWTLDELTETVVEALDLARIRAVDPQQLWLAGRILPALYVANNVVGDTSAIDFGRLQFRHGTKGLFAGKVTG